MAGAPVGGVAGAGSPGAPTGGVGGLSPTSTLSSLTPEQLSQLAGQVGSADPSLASQALGLIKTPLSAVGTILHVAGAPGRFIERSVLGSNSGSEFLDKLGFKTGGSAPEALLRGIASFGLDAATDPLTYLTGGTGGVATDAAKTGLLHAGLDAAAPEGWDLAKAAGKSAIDFATDQPEGSVARALAEGVNNTPSYARALQNARDVLSGAGVKDAFEANLPDILKGGLRFKVPFADAGFTLIPSEVTGKLTAPLGEAIKSSGAYDTLARNLSRFHTVLTKSAEAGQGAEGAITRTIEQRATSYERSANNLAADLKGQIDRAFGRDEQGLALAHAAFNAPEKLPEALAAKGQPELTAAQKELLPKVAAFHESQFGAKVKNFGPELVPHIENYSPRVLTPEARKALAGGAEGNPIGKLLQSSVSGSMQHRAEELAGLGFSDSQKLMSERYGLDKFYLEDPSTALVLQAKDDNRAIAQKMLSDQLEAKGLVRGPTNISTSELQRAGLDLKTARNLVRDGIEDPRLQALSPETTHALQVQASVDRMASLEKLPKATEKVLKSQNNLSRLVTSAVNKQEEFQRAADYAQRIAAFGDAKAAKLAREQAKNALFDFQNTSDAIDRAETLLSERTIRKTNLEAGLKSDGDLWPVVEAGTPEGWRAISLATPGILNGKVAPDWLATELENGLAREKVSAFGRQFDQFTNAYKHILTSPITNPAFALKRFEGMAFAHSLVGGDFGELGSALKLAQAVHSNSAIDLAGELAPGLSTQEFLQRFTDSGVGKAAVTETGELLDPAHLVSGDASRLHQPGFGNETLAKVTHGIDSVGHRVLGQVDTTGRMATFLHGLKVSGNDNEFARLLTLQVHGDFGEMTPFERSVMKRIVPFYTWVRTKTPLILKAFAENPSPVVNSQRAFADILGNPDATQQSYNNGTMPVSQALKGGVIAGGPMQDLFNLLGAKNPVALSSDLPTFSLNNELSRSGILSSLNPVFGQTIGLLTHTANYPGQVEPLKFMQKASGAAVPLAKVLEHTPFLSTLVARTPGGELRMNSSLASLVQQLPTSMVVSLIQTIPGLGSKGPGGVKYVLPVTATELTPNSVNGQLTGDKAALQALVSEEYARGEKANLKAAGYSPTNPTGSAPKVVGLKLPKRAKITTGVALP